MNEDVHNSNNRISLYVSIYATWATATNPYHRCTIGFQMGLFGLKIILLILIDWSRVLWRYASKRKKTTHNTTLEGAQKVTQIINRYRKLHGFSLTPWDHFWASCRGGGLSFSKWVGPNDLLDRYNPDMEPGNIVQNTEIKWMYCMEKVND